MTWLAMTPYPQDSFTCYSAQFCTAFLRISRNITVVNVPKYLKQDLSNPRLVLFERREMVLNPKIGMI